MRNFTQFLLLAGFFFCSLTMLAQESGFNCSFDHMMRKQFENNPGLREEYEQINKDLTKRSEAAAASGLKEDKVYRIPVVFHIIHNYGAENISEAQVRSAIQVMNEEFGKTNAASANIVPLFQPVAADCDIEFRLATLDPNGECTNGIIRYVDSRTEAADDNVKSGRQWPRQKYLNIYVVRKIGDAGVAGYAYYPGTASPTVDGVIINHDYVGRIGTGTQGRSSALTHEVGHYLSLSHTWGNTNNPGVACGGTDFVGDTPECKGSSVCNLNTNTCNDTVPGDSIDNIQNFMEYAYCYAMFTNGQKARMRTTLNSSTASRNNLWTDLNIAATGTNYEEYPTYVCKADFLPATNKPICQGSSVKFNDYSYFNITSWKWTFEGGTPATSTEQNPTVTYDNAGVFKVTLEVSDGTNTRSVTKENQVVVLQSNALGGAPYRQDFENLSLLTDTDFKVTNPNNDRTWQIKDGVGYESNRSIYIQNRLIATDGNEDELVSNTFDLSNALQPKLTFQYAHAAQVSSTNNDQLELWTSTDCGETWQRKKIFSGTNLETAPNVAGTDFVPANSSQWKYTEYSLNLLKVSGFRFKFIWVNGSGNNIYLDNINVTDIDAIGENGQEAFHFNVFPNPVEYSTEVNFFLQQASPVTVELVDLLGRTVKHVFSGQLGAGEQNLTIAKDNITPGVYLVKLSIGERSFSNKIMIK